MYNMVGIRSGEMGVLSTSPFGDDNHLPSSFLIRLDPGFSSDTVLFIVGFCLLKLMDRSENRQNAKFYASISNLFSRKSDSYLEGPNPKITTWKS